MIPLSHSVLARGLTLKNPLVTLSTHHALNNFFNKKNDVFISNKDVISC